MPIDFPSSPTTNQTYTYLGRVYTYNGSAWDLTYTSANVITSVTNTAPIGSVTNASGNIVTISHLNSGVIAATYGGAAVQPVLVVDAFGHITSVSNVTTTVANTNITGNIIASQIHPTGVTPLTYGGTSNIPVIVIDRQGRITSASNAAITAGVSSVGGATGAVSNAQVAAAATAGGISSDESLIYPMLLGGM